MKKIVLLSVLFGLFTNSASATYYKTYSANCDTRAMMAKLDRATADHRAVITEVQCASRPATNHGAYYASQNVARPGMYQVTTSEVFVKRSETVQYVEYREPVRYVYRPVVKCRPHVFVATVSEQVTECNGCCGCNE